MPNQVVWKFEIQRGKNTLMPHGAQILRAGTQNGQIYVWAWVDPDQSLINYQIEVFGTGHHIPEPSLLSYIDTVIMGPYVFHVFLRNE